jgi:hypothetical protein
MDEQDDIFDTCDHCGKPIFYGNACVTITRSIEQVDRTPEYPEGVVNVIDSVVLYTFCAECGNQVVTATQPEN